MTIIPYNNYTKIIKLCKGGLCMLLTILAGAALWYIVHRLYYPAADAVLILYALCVVRCWVCPSKEPDLPDLPDTIMTPDGNLHEKRE